MLLKTPKWPDSLPSSQGSKFIFGLNCGNTSLSWSLLSQEQNFGPGLLRWTTNPATDEINLSLFLPDALKRDIMATIPVNHRNEDISNAELCRALVLHRGTILTVYVLSSNKSHQAAALKLFDGLPAVIYQLTNADFLQHDPELSAYETMGTDRIAALMGARQLFPDRRSHLVIDGGTALTTTTIIDNRLGGTIGCGPRIKLSALKTGTASLPQIDSFEELIRNSNLEDGEMEKFATRGTVDNMIGFVLQETTLTLRHYIEYWRKSLPKNIPKEQVPVVVLCGGDGVLLSKLLRPHHDGIISTDPATTKFFQTGEFFDRPQDFKVPESDETAFQVVYQKHLIHFGIQYVLARQETGTALLDSVRSKLLGQRVVVGGKRGTILSMNPSEDNESLVKDVLKVFLEGENKHVDLGMTKIVEGLQKYSQVGEDTSTEQKKIHSIPMLNKIKDAIEALTSVRTLLDPKEDDSKDGGEDAPTNSAPSITNQTRNNSEEASANSSAKPAKNSLKTHTAASERNEETKVTRKERVVLDLYRLCSKKRLELKSLMRLSEVELRGLLSKRVNRIFERDPDFDFDEEENLWRLLQKINTRIYEKDKKASSSQTSSLNATSAKPTKGNEEKKSEKKQSLARDIPKDEDPSKSLLKKRITLDDGTLATSAKKKKKKKSDDSEKEELVGRRVAKYFRNADNKNQLYRGKVVAFFPSKEVEIGVDLWQIKFDDGDEEDVEYEEVTKIVNQYQKHKTEFFK